MKKIIISIAILIAILFTTNVNAATSATFTYGSDFNTKLKKLTLNSSSASTFSTDTILKEIRRADELIDGSKITVSTKDSQVPIYLWYDEEDAIAYYYTEADKLFLNPNSSYMFAYFKALEYIDLTQFSTAKVTNMSYMFYNMSAIEELNLTKFNTSNVINMSSMFYGMINLENLNISNFDTSKVTDMSYMFSSNHKMQTLNLNNFDTSNVTNMSYMFSNMINLKNLNISNFNTSKVANMSHMFYRCEKLGSLSISNFDTSKVTDMSYMFYNCEKLESLNISNFNTSSVTSMAYMFYGMSNIYELNLSNFDTSKVTNMNSMFYSCNKIEFLDLSSFNTANVTSMSHIVSSMGNLKSLDISNFELIYIDSNSQDFLKYASLSRLKTPKYIADGIEIAMHPWTILYKDDVRYSSLNSTTPTQTWIASKVTIIYNTLGANLNLQSTRADIMAGDIFTLESPNNDNYNFYGWYTDQEYTNKFNGNTTYENMTLYAKWTGKINKATISNIRNEYYTGAEITQWQVVTFDGKELREGIDYLVSYSNNVNAGTATITVTGNGKYVGSKSRTFNILKTRVEYFDTSYDIPTMYYTGNPITPKPSYIKMNGVTLEENRDYKLTYKNNINVGTATMTITGIGNCEGTVEVAFTIEQGITLNKTSVAIYKWNTFKLEGYAVDNEELLYESLDPTIASVDDTGLIIAKKIGTTKIRVTTPSGKLAVVTVGVYPVRANMVEYKNVAAQSYTGNEITPKVVIKYLRSTLKEGRDYTLTYSNNINVGKGNVIVTFIGNYTGTKTLPFVIVPTPGEITRVSNPSTKTVKVYYASSTGATSYQIAYRAKGSTTWQYARTVALYGNLRNLDLIRYEIKVRPYVTIDNSNYYGAWSPGVGINVK